MNITSKKFTACVAALTVLAGVAWADDKAQERNPNPPQPSQRPDKDYNKNQSQTSIQPTASDKVSTLLGMPVKDQTGNKIGDIKEVVVDPQSGKVAYTVFGTTGKERRFAIPLNAYQPSSDHKHLVLYIDKQKLETARGFEDNAWPSIGNPNFPTDSFYQTQVKTSSAIQPGVEINVSATGKNTSIRSTSGAPTDLNKGSKLIGLEVKNSQNEDLGKIKDMVIDFQSQRVSYVVLSHGGALGVGDKMLAVPMQAFSFAPDQKNLVLNVTKDRLQTAQGFENNNWPSVNNPSWGANPFWETDRTRDLNRSNPDLNKPGTSDPNIRSPNPDLNRPANPDPNRPGNRPQNP